jgi:outer membrane murein-binding lipoprotein Lpp
LLWVLFLLRWGANLVADPSSAPEKTEESKMASLRKSLATIALTIAGGLSLGACATEDYVDEHIATVNERISALESRVQGVDGAAQSAAAAAQTANQRIDTLTTRVDAIEQEMAARQQRQRTPRN